MGNANPFLTSLPGRVGQNQKAFCHHQVGRQLMDHEAVAAYFGRKIRPEVDRGHGY